MGDPPRALATAVNLWIWLVVGGVVGAILLAGCLYSDRADQLAQDRLARDVRNQVEILDQLPAPNARSGPVVVIVGTSLIKAALRMRGAPLDKIPPAIKLVVLSGDRLQSGWFEALVPALHRAHPDLLLFEAALLQSPGPQPRRRNRIEHLLRALSWGKHSPGPPPPCEGLTLRRRPEASGTGAMYQSVFDPRRLQLDRLPILEGFRQDGITVGVLELPRAMVLVEAAPNIEAWDNKAAAGVMADGFFVWRVPGKWPADQFCDMAHLNLEGSQAFGSWFGPQLAHALNLTQ